MKKAVLVFVLALAAPAVFAQSWRDRPYQRYTDNTFDITPFAGYRWGGTIYADQTSLYGTNADLNSSANYGVSFGIPVAPNGMKVELLVDRQDTQIGNGAGLFDSTGTFGDFHVTYYHGGLLIPFNQSRGTTPFVVVSAGIANLDPAMQGVSSANKFSASAGIGVKVPLNPNLALRVEARGFYTAMSNGSNCSHCYFTNGYNHDLYQSEASVGLSVRF